jgi:hypothetical protein
MTEEKKRVNPIQAQKYLKGADYPSSKEELVDTAKRNGADRYMLDALSSMPDKTYERPSDVAKEMGKRS